MEEKKSKKISLVKVICIIIISLLTIVLGIVYYFGVIKNNEKISKLSDEKLLLQNEISSLQENNKIIENEKESNNNNSNTTSTLTKEEVTKITQEVYSKAYDEIGEGFGLTGGNTINITAGEEGTVGGVINVEAHKVDFSKIESYFTERAINYIKTGFTDTPYGHKNPDGSLDGNYYIYVTKNVYSNDRKYFIRTIFGITDQSKRNFDVKLYDDNMIVAVSEKSSFLKLDEYLVLKKVNDIWKIDMFQEL